MTEKQDMIGKIGFDFRVMQENTFQNSSLTFLCLEKRLKNGRQCYIQPFTCYQLYFEVFFFFLGGGVSKA